MKTQSLTIQQKDLIRYFGAKRSEEASASEYLLSWTEHHMFILSPRSKITKSRKVICQLPA